MTAISAGVRRGRWELVSSLSCAGFTVRNLGLRTVHGRVPILDAFVDVDADGAPTAVRATLDLAGVDTANARRDRDLRAPRLLGTATHPLMTFNGVPRRVTDGEWAVDGRLDARGTAVELTLHAAVRHHDDRITIDAVGALDRRDLGVRAPRFLIGTRIAITVAATFAPPYPRPPTR